jgi:hypothetical protein
MAVAVVVVVACKPTLQFALRAPTDSKTRASSQAGNPLHA